ncbi:MAG: PmoA family protein [Thermoguttaceae bacterium]|jgi:hypothetical protein|nr:PmoA family protein [Thermoguttaceae bacterium]
MPKAMTWQLLLANVALLTVAGALVPSSRADAPATAVTFQRDDDAGQLRVLIDGKEAFVYQYGKEADLTHFWPLRSPSGKNMLTQQADPFPHHRAFWFADTVQLDGGRRARFYDALYTGEDRRAPFRDRIRYNSFTTLEPGDVGRYQEKLVWTMDHDVPVLDERRDVRIVPLGDGEYLLDITFTLTAAYGDVAFVSDAVHYAWPYLRINKTFNGEHGGTITNDRGQTGQKATNMQPALWVDYFNTADGTAEGLAVFQWPDPDSQPRRWLTREYGTFGPRRPDAQSGKPFTLTEAKTLSQRVGVLVHRGDVGTGRVAERYGQYIKDEL